MPWDPPEILVVDESIADLNRLSQLITRFIPRAKVTIVSRCDEVEVRLKACEFDLVITDLVMVGQDGQDVIDLIQCLPKIPAVILVTAEGDERIAAECLRRGAIAYLLKQDLDDQLECALNETAAVVREAGLYDRLMAHVVQARCEFEIDSDLSQVQALSNFIRQRLQTTTVLSAQRVDQITGCIHEALLNAHYHGNMKANDFPFQHARPDYIEVAEQRSADPMFADCRIRLILEHQQDQLRITICDAGQGFDVASLAKWDRQADDRGAGICRMQLEMTSIHWNSTGNEMTLIDDSAVLKSTATRANSTAVDSLSTRPSA